jgi:hypothetical protein
MCELSFENSQYKLFAALRVCLPLLFDFEHEWLRHTFMSTACPTGDICFILAVSSLSFM